MEPILKIENLRKYYGTKELMTKALNNISFEVEKGEFIAVMGASGSGKTTLLNCISTIDVVTSGNVFFQNRDITKLELAELTKFRRDNLGFIFQEFNLLDTLTAYENIALSLSITNTPINLIDKYVQEIAKALDIIKILDKYPTEMSGGEKQRIAAARAIVTNPTLILADEPTGSLDSRAAKILLENLVKINEEINSTIILATHDTYVASYCSRVMFIKDGKIFNELDRGDYSRSEFFDKIMDVLTLLGGEIND